MDILMELRAAQLGNRNTATRRADLAKACNKLGLSENGPKAALVLRLAGHEVGLDLGPETTMADVVGQLMAKKAKKKTTKKAKK